MTARRVGAGSRALRVRQAHVDWLDARLSARDRTIVQTVARLRLVSSSQLERLHFSELAAPTRARIRRRVLARLVAWRLLMSLERRIGGVRAGSAGLVFALDSAGQQLARLDGSPVRRPREPSVALLGHSLAASELCVALVELSRAGGFTVASYQTEPGCWHPNGVGGWLKPDAYCKLATHEFDDHWWIEVDRGTEHLPTLRRKLMVYLDYAAVGGLGPNGILPRVLVTVPTEARRMAIAEIIERLPDTDKLLHVVTEAQATNYLVRMLRE